MAEKFVVLTLFNAAPKIKLHLYCIRVSRVQCAKISHRSSCFFDLARLRKEPANKDVALDKPGIFAENFHGELFRLLESTLHMVAGRQTETSTLMDGINPERFLE